MHPLVAVLVSGQEARARLHQALRGYYRVVFCGSARELIQTLRHSEIAAVIISLRDSAGTPTAPTIRRVRAGYPSVPVLAYCLLRPDDVHGIVTAARAGINEVVLHGLDDAGVALRRAMGSAIADSAADEGMQVVKRVVPVELHPLFEYCLRYGKSPLTIGDVTSILGVSRRTLHNRLESAKLPPLSRIITWCRLLLAARYMDDPLRPVDRIALDLDFPSPSALRNALKRYTGLTPAALRERGGFAHFLALFEKALVSGAARNSSETVTTAGA